MHLETQSLKVCCKFIAKFSASGGRKSPGPLPGSAPGPVADSRGAYAPKPQNVQLPLYVPIPKSKMLSASGSQAPWDPQPRGTFGFGSERKYPSLYWLQNRENKAFSCFQWMLESSKAFSFRGASPPWPPTRGSAAGPRWGLRPQTPVIGSRSTRSPCAPPKLNSWIRQCLWEKGKRALCARTSVYAKSQCHVCLSVLHSEALVDFQTSVHNTLELYRDSWEAVQVVRQLMQEIRHGNGPRLMWYFSAENSVHVKVICSTNMSPQFTFNVKW